MTRIIPIAQITVTCRSQIILQYFHILGIYYWCWAMWTENGSRREAFGEPSRRG